MLRQALFVASMLPWICAAQAAPATQPTTAVSAQTQPAPAAPAIAASKVVAVTVYQGNALVTREVQAGPGQGLVEMVVGPLPAQTIDSSLYTEGTEGIRILTTQFRTRAVMQDTRATVRAKEDQIRSLTQDNLLVQNKLEVGKQNQAMLGKLENFTSATLTTLTDKGMLSAENTVKLANFLMETRTTLGTAEVTLQEQLRTNSESIEFLRRQLAELAVGADRSEREAVIVADKTNAAAGKVRLNYLVGSAGWQPQYKLRAGGEKDPVTVEYLAGIQQQSGEDWTGVDLVLSTAQPLLNAAPPELLALNVDSNVVGQSAQLQQTANAEGPLTKSKSYQVAKDLRASAQKAEANNDQAKAKMSLNSAAASEQYAELLAEEAQGASSLLVREGPSVAYHLKDKLTVPNRNDPQFVEIARIELDPTYFYKVVPVLSQHVYRLANLTNKSDYVLLPGEATMYVGSDFVGRMTLPLVAIGEQFVAGFGVDPQVQVDRQLVTKNHAVQGGNQVQTYDYRIRVSSFKQSDITLQVWDRVPHAETEAVAVELVKSTPELSTDVDYLRNDRPKNLLRWDLDVKANTTGAKAADISYEFKLQYAKDLSIGNLIAK